MEQSNQPKKATPEQNAEFNRQLRDVLVNNGIALANTSTEGRDRHTVIGDKTYSQLLNVITSLSENTRNTHQVWSFLESTLKLNTDAISKQQDEILELKIRLEKMERSQENVIIDSSVVDKTIKDHENRLDILNKASKGHAERLNKMEKLK